MRSSSLVVPLACAAVVLSPPRIRHLQAQNGPPIALTGQVTSAEEGPMEGVLVSAKPSASSMTVTVVSDREGRYHFPEGRLTPGAYSIRIRAAGYDLDAPAETTVAAHATARLDLKLRKARDLASQLTNADWFASFP